MNTISILGGIAAILLIIELLIAVGIVGGIVYILRRGLIASRREAAPYIQHFTEQVQQVEKLTTEYANRIVGFQVEAISTVHGLHQGVQALLHEASVDDDDATLE